MSNSSLVNYTKISPNKTVNRNHKIDTITIHCVVGQASVETLGAIFAPSSRQASSNYGIGYDGRIGMYVEEKDRSWCTSSPSNDHRAVTIEVASDTTEPYAVNDKAYASLLNLVTDICKRNGIKKLVWSTNKTDRVNHKNGCNMTVHRDYANKSCPGTYLYNKHAEIATEVNKRLGAETEEKPNVSEKISVIYQVWEDVGNRWLPEVTDLTDYAGLYGKDVCCVYARLTSGNIFYKVHYKGGKWLPEVKNREDYAGLYNKPIDGLMMRTDTGKTIKYAVHLRSSNRWLPFVSGYDESDFNNGYAGILGQEIDGIKIYIE